MKKFSFLYIAASFSVLLACSTNGLHKSTVSYNKWYGGQQGVSGVKYTFSVPQIDNYRLDSISLDDKLYKNLNPFLVSDTLMVLINISNPRVLDGEQVSDKFVSPKKATLYFSNKKKDVQNIEITKFKEDEVKLYQ